MPIPSRLGRRGSHHHSRNRGLTTRGRCRPGRLVRPAHGWESRRRGRRRVVSEALGICCVGGIAQLGANATAAAGCDVAKLARAAVQARRAWLQGIAEFVLQTLAARLGRRKAAAVKCALPGATQNQVVRFPAQERRLAVAHLQRAVRPAREVSQDVASLAHDALLGVAVALGAPNPAFLSVFWGRRGPLGIWGGRGAGGTKTHMTPSIDGAMGRQWGRGKQQRRCACAQNTRQQDKQRTQLKCKRLSHGCVGRTRLAMFVHGQTTIHGKPKKGQLRILPGTCRCHPEHSPRACVSWGMSGTQLISNEATSDNPAVPRMKNSKRSPLAHRCTHGAPVFVALQAVGRAVVKLGFHGGCAVQPLGMGVHVLRNTEEMHEETNALSCHSHL